MSASSETRPPKDGTKFLEDADKMYTEYKKNKGRSTFDTYQKDLKASFHHTLNSHVFGLTSKAADGAKTDEDGYALHSGRAEAEAAHMKEANIDHKEFSRIFYSVDAVHAYT